MHKKRKNKKSKETEKVILNKDSFVDFINNKTIIREFKIPLKWNKKIGLKENEQFILRVKGASLDDHIQCKSLANQPGILFSYINKCSEKGEKVDFNKIMEIINSEKIGNSTIFELSVFKRNVVDPKFTFEEILQISEKAPRFINEVVKFSLDLTEIEQS